MAAGLFPAGGKDELAELVITGVEIRGIVRRELIDLDRRHMGIMTRAVSASGIV